MKAVRVGMAAVLGLACLPTGATAQDAPSDSARLRQMLACDGIARKSARLACYDDLAHPRAGRPVVAERTAPAPAPDPVSPQAFGLETVKVERERRERDRPAKLEQISATATAARDDGIGHWIITLDNGARWQMIEREPGFAPPRSGAPVIIRRAAMGSYLMEVAHQQAVRVQRLE